MSHYSDVILGETGLLSYWRMGDAGTVIVDYNGGNDGTLVGVDPADRQLISGVSNDSDGNKATRFQGGGDRVDGPNFLNRVNQSISVEAWIRMEILPSINGDHMVVASKWAPNPAQPGNVLTGTGWKLYVHTTDQLIFIVGDSVGATYVASASDLVADRWYHQNRRR